MVSGGKPEHPLPPRRPFNRRQMLLQAVVAAVILVSGIGIGAGGTILALKNRLVPRLRLPPPSPPGMEPNFLVARWTDDYGLSEKQAKQVKDTLIKQFAATRKLWEDFAAAEQNEREKFAASMKKTLRPEQFSKWDEDLKERMKHFRGMRPFDGRGGRGGPRGDRRFDRPKDPNDHRWDGQPRPATEGENRRGPWSSRSSMNRDNRRGDWPPRGPMDPNNRPADQPAQLTQPPGEVNAPK
jgi:hypothetical protein